MSEPPDKVRPDDLDSRVPTDAYAVFCGAINQESVSKLLACLSTATTKNQNVHLLFQSSDGSVGEGICLYNVFKSLPLG